MLVAAPRHGYFKLDLDPGPGRPPLTGVSVRRRRPVSRPAAGWVWAQIGVTWAPRALPLCSSSRLEVTSRVTGVLLFVLCRTIQVTVEPVGPRPRKPARLSHGRAPAGSPQ